MRAAVILHHEHRRLVRRSLDRLRPAVAADVLAALIRCGGGQCSRRRWPGGRHGVR